jgi:thioredoxin-related protein
MSVFKSVVQNSNVAEGLFLLSLFILTITKPKDTHLFFAFLFFAFSQAYIVSVFYSIKDIGVFQQYAILSFVKRAVNYCAF